MTWALPTPREPHQLWLTGMAPLHHLESHWSPTPIIGYRMWWQRRGRWSGARSLWHAPVMHAACLPKGRPGAPHLRSQGVCLGSCGINAYADPTALSRQWDAGRPLKYRDSSLTRDRLPLLFGVVALSGRVVEHDNGYRARHALVTGLVHFEPMEARSTDDPDRIRAAFADGPAGGLEGWTREQYPSVDFHEWKGPPHDEVIASALHRLARRTRERITAWSTPDPHREDAT